MNAGIDLVWIIRPLIDSDQCVPIRQGRKWPVYVPNPIPFLINTEETILETGWGIGIPQSDSVYQNYALENAFTDWKFWESKSEMPQYIGMSYPTVHTVVRIGFSPEYNLHAPDRFLVVGSNCTGPWTILLHVNSSGYPNNWQNDGFKSWSIPETNRRPFRCIGLNVLSVQNKDWQYVRLNNFTLWEKPGEWVSE